MKIDMHVPAVPVAPWPHLDPLDPIQVAWLNSGLARPATHGPHGSLHWVPDRSGHSPGIGLRLALAAAADAQPWVLRLPSLLALSPWFSGPVPLWGEGQQHWLIELALAPLLEALAAALGQPLALQSLLPPLDAPEEAEACCIGLLWQSSGDQAALAAALEFHPAGWPAPARTRTPQHQRSHTLATWATLPCTLTVQLHGHCRLQSSDLSRLRLGDVLQLDTAPQWPLQQLRLLYPCGQVRAHALLRDDAHLLITHAMTEYAAPVEQTEPTACADLLSTLPVNLTFELNPLQIGLAALHDLREGTVLTLAQRITAPLLTIRANGVPLGQGELVRVGDDVAVRLLHWQGKLDA